ncbi:MAG: response regulator [Myxococcales bacterium]|nr:response regulator [Myxococcales bacterium]
MPLALVVTSDSASRGSLVSVLNLTGWRVLDVPTVTAGMQQMRAQLPELLILDQKLPDEDALGMLSRFRHMPGSETVVVAVMVDKVERATALSFVKAGVAIFVAKPIDLIDLCQKLAGKFSGVSRLEPPEPSNDPLARPLVVLVSQNLNARDATVMALGDEYDVFYYDGMKGLDGERREAAVIIVDEGMLGGFDALPQYHALFGKVPAIALTARGVEVPGYEGALVKPVRDLTVKRVVRQITNRSNFGVLAMPSGVIIRMRDGWHSSAEAYMEGLCDQVTEICAMAKGSDRRWVCIDGPYVGATEHINRSKQVYQAAAAVKGLHVGIITVLGDLTRVAFEMRIPPTFVQNTAANFIKVAQDLV